MSLSIFGFVALLGACSVCCLARRLGSLGGGSRRRASLLLARGCNGHLILRLRFSEYPFRPIVRLALKFLFGTSLDCRRLFVCLTRIFRR